MPFLRILAAASLGMTLPTVVLADDLPLPTGQVVLTITGEIAHTSAPGEAAFDLEMLRALDDSTITTDTIWTEGKHTFTGVRLDRLLEHVGAADGMIRAQAINDYSVEIPTSDASADGPIVAYLLDGETMPRRNKGPLWIIYPYSSSNKYRSEVIYARSIWQLDRLSINQSP